MSTLETDIRQYIKLQNRCVSKREYPRLLQGYDILENGSVAFYNGRNIRCQTLTPTEIKDVLEKVVK